MNLTGNIKQAAAELEKEANRGRLMNMLLRMGDKAHDGADAARRMGRNVRHSGIASGTRRAWDWSGRNPYSASAVASVPYTFAETELGLNPLAPDLPKSNMSLQEKGLAYLLNMGSLAALRTGFSTVKHNKAFRQANPNAEVMSGTGYKPIVGGALGLVGTTPGMVYATDFLNTTNQSNENIKLVTDNLGQFTNDGRRSMALVKAVLEGKEQVIPLADGTNETVSSPVSIKDMVEPLASAGEGMKGLSGALQFAPVTLGAGGGFFLGGKLADLMGSKNESSARRKRTAGQLLGAIGGGVGGYYLNEALKGQG